MQRRLFFKIQTKTKIFSAIDVGSFGRRELQTVQYPAKQSNEVKSLNH